MSSFMPPEETLRAIVVGAGVPNEKDGVAAGLV